MSTLKNKNIGNYFGATPDRPYHLSVGAVVLNENNEAICLYYPKIGEISDIYKAPTGTVEPGESLETTVQREMIEELGTQVDIIAFLGSLVKKDIWWGEIGKPTEVEKSIMFFLVRAVRTVPYTKENDCSVVVKPLDFVIDSLRNLRLQDGMRDFAQLEIFQRAKNWIDSHTS